MSLRQDRGAGEGRPGQIRKPPGLRNCDLQEDEKRKRAGSGKAGLGLKPKKER